MGVYIKGMKLPKPKLTDMATVYHAYVLVSPNGHAAIVVDNEEGLDSSEYSLVPVPPHGRMIDADALLKNGADYEYPLFDTDGSWDCCTPCFDVDSIKNAPTIIPAEEG